GGLRPADRAHLRAARRGARGAGTQRGGTRPAEEGAGAAPGAALAAAEPRGRASCARQHRRGEALRRARARGAPALRQHRVPARPDPDRRRRVRRGARGRGGGARGRRAEPRVAEAVPARHHRDRGAVRRVPQGPAEGSARRGGGARPRGAGRGAAAHARSDADERGETARADRGLPQRRPRRGVRRAAPPPRRPSGRRRRPAQRRRAAPRTAGAAHRGTHAPPARRARVADRAAGQRAEADPRRGEPAYSRAGTTTAHTREPGNREMRTSILVAAPAFCAALHAQCTQLSMPPFAGAPVFLSLDRVTAPANAPTDLMQCGGFTATPPATWTAAGVPDFDLDRAFRNLLTPSCSVPRDAPLPDVDAISIGMDWVLADDAGRVLVPADRWG